MKSIKIFGLLLVSGLLLLTSQTHAQGQQQHGDYTVYHTIFNSTFLKPDIASQYDLVRGNQWFLVNISVNGAGKTFGQEAVLKGTATNLMQQQKKLAFKTIQEGDATYYIAPLRIAGQDIMHFAIDVQTDSSAEPFTVKFTHKFAKE
jgi:hypothetical protein